MIDPEVADNAVNTLSRHLFYLTQELVVLSLFSNKVSEDEKLVSCEKPDDWKPEKPSIPELQPTTTLASLVGVKSWTMFHVLGLESDWVSLPPEEWESNGAFIEAKQFARTCKVVNDSCERGVKLVTDYCNRATKDPETRRHLLRAVQINHEEVPDFRKKTLAK